MSPPASSLPDDPGLHLPFPPVFPSAPGAPLASRFAASPPLLAPALPTAPSREESMPLRFLLVDDDDVDREVVRRLLSRIDPSHELVEAVNITDAREKLENGQFDCVLLDYHLGGARGLDLLPFVAAHRTEICPVILITLRETEALIVEAIRSGVSDYIAKGSLDEQRLHSVLDTVLARAAVEEQRLSAERHFRKLAESMRLNYEESLRATAERAESAMRAKTQFLANMSHEIRTPLNTVIGIAYLLRHTALDASQADLVDKIEVASKTLLGIVNNVLDTSKLDDKSVRLEHIPLRLTDLVDDLRKMTEVQIGERDLALRFSIAPDVPPQILGDPTRLHQILSNLLTNAIKFTPKGHIELTITTFLDADQAQRFAITVSDTGIGIERDMIDRLFERFTQADSSTTRQFGGSGLGLAITRDLVTLMGGTISAESEPGHGTRFRVELPCQPFVETEPAQQLIDEDMAGSHRLAGLRVLLVDDCEINLDIASRILAMESAQVSTATNGQQAVDMALDSANAFDIILMDLQMPVLDGHDAFNRIRGARGHARPPVLALTAAAGDLVGNGFELGGMDGLVSKPFNVEDLVRAILRHTRNNAPAIRALRHQEQAASVHETDLAWPQFSHIDTDQACLRLGGDQALFKSALSRLLQDNGDLAVHIAMDDSAALRSRLHRLKGSAGLVGAGTLRHAVHQAEMASHKQDLPELGRSLAIVVRELDLIRAETTPYLQFIPFGRETLHGHSNAPLGTLN